MFDLERLEDMSYEIIQADKALRKTIKMPSTIGNPHLAIGRLTGLAQAAASAANALAIIMSMEDDMRSLEGDLRGCLADEQKTA
jgi:hypothetical protein